MGQVVPKRRYRITTIRCVTTHKSAVLIWFAAEAGNDVRREQMLNGDTYVIDSSTWRQGKGSQLVQGVQLKSGPYLVFTKIYNMLYYTTNLNLSTVDVRHRL